MPHTRLHIAHLPRRRLHGGYFSPKGEYEEWYVRAIDGAGQRGDGLEPTLSGDKRSVRVSPLTALSP